MNNRFSAFIFRTRGIYMFIALTASIILKVYSHGITPLLFFIIGITTASAIQLFRMYSASYLWGRQATAKVEANFLCTSGPYAYVRNPLYLGNFIIGISISIAINEWYSYALFTASYAFVYSLVIPYEEKFLQEKFGYLYVEYKAHTGRLIPVLKGYKGGTKVIPDFKAGILGEIHAPFVIAIIFIIIYLLFVR